MAGRAESENFRTLANVDISAGFAPIVFGDTGDRVPPRHSIHGVAGGRIEAERRQRDRYA